MTMKNEQCEIVMVLDESGSMSACKSATISGVNEFLMNQKRIKGDANVTLVKFSDYYTVINDAVPLNQVTYLGESNYTPSYTTSLLDAVGITINSISNRLANMPDENWPQKVIFVVITDGYENTSKEFSRKQVFEMVSYQKLTHNWEFIFLGADIDSWGEKIGIVFNVNIQKNDLKRSFKGLSHHVLNCRMNKIFEGNDSFDLSEEQLDRNLNEIGSYEDME